MLDRFDIFAEVPRVEYDKLADDRLGEPSEGVQTRVEAAREVQRRRFSESGISCNAEMTPVEVREFCPLDEESQGLLRSATTRLSLSARGFHRILKTARTIADLESSDGIKSYHVAEAIQYRPRRPV